MSHPSVATPVPSNPFEGADRPARHRRSAGSAVEVSARPFRPRGSTPRPSFGRPDAAENRHGGCSSPTATMAAPVATATLPSWVHRRRRPVLLVHGFLATSRVVAPLAYRLRRLGYCPHDVDLGGLFGRFNARPVEELAAVVAERVEQLACEHRCDRIDLVGHSEGGLIGRYYVQKLEGARRVRHLVTLGTPHRGTRWAHAGRFVGHVLPSVHQMAPGSPLLRELPDHGFPSSVRLTSIYSQRDSICPPSSCRLEIRWAPHLENVDVLRGGHLDLLVSAAIPSIIHRVLASEEPPERGATQRAVA
jgi:triacylglycerol lipase